MAITKVTIGLQAVSPMIELTSRDWRSVTNAIDALAETSAARMLQESAETELGQRTSCGPAKQ